MEREKKIEKKTCCPPSFFFFKFGFFFRFPRRRAEQDVRCGIPVNKEQDIHQVLFELEGEEKKKRKALSCWPCWFCGIGFWVVVLIGADPSLNALKTEEHVRVDGK